MGKKSKGKKKRQYNPPNTPAPSSRKKAGGPPMGLIAMVGGGLLLVVLGMLFSDRNQPTEDKVAKRDRVEEAAPADAAKADKSKAKSTSDKTGSKATRGKGPNTLLATLPAGADTFGGDDARAKSFADLMEKTGDRAKYRAALKDAQALKESVGAGPGAAEAATLTAFFQLNSRNVKGATETIEAALAADPGEAREALETLALQARLDDVPRGSTPPQALVSDLETHLGNVSSDAAKASTAYHLGRALQKQGKEEEAINRFEEVARAWPDTSEAPAALYSMGQYYESNEETAKALAAYDQVSKDYPFAPEAKRSRQYAGQLRVVGKAGKDIPVQEWINDDPGTLTSGLDGKVVLYLFWASWCPHCRKEMPHMVELYNKYKDEGLVIVGVTNLDKRQNRDKVVDYIEGESVPFPIAIQDGRGGSQHYAVGGIPAAALVDRSGTIRWRNHPARGVEDMIKKLLAEAGEPS